MVKFLISALLGTALISQQFTPVPGELLIPEAQAEEIAPKMLTLSELYVLIARFGTQFHVKQASLRETILCEAKANADGTLDPRAQSEHINDKGIREDSWGIAQIHLPDHPTISKEQAQDPEFAVKFMAEQFAAGNALWTCFRTLKSSGKI